MIYLSCIKCKFSSNVYHADLGISEVVHSIKVQNVGMKINEVR